MIISCKMNPPLHIEVVQNNQSCASADQVRQLVHSYLTNFQSLTPGATVTTNELESVDLKEHVESIHFCDMDHTSDVSMTTTELIFHVHKLESIGGEIDTIADGTSGEALPAATLWPLPSRELCGLWDSLVYETGVKEDIMHFVETAFHLSSRGVNPDLVACNRVVLLHGPPGTGKTSLCRAVAHKLAVRFSDRYPRAVLVEVNAHGLFSKWFSESGKLVSRMFARVRELLEDNEMLVVVLVDEVESLTAARRGAIAGGEPSDALRVVNAVLTQLDALRPYGNALVLTTSNVTDAIDPAFVDRADVKRYIGPPGESAAYAVLRSGADELMRAGIVAPREQLFPLRLLEACGEAATTQASVRIREAASAAVHAGLSGRALRRLPLLALARAGCHTCSLSDFLDAMQRALRDHKADTDMLAMYHN